jgi:hypothetical protein
VICNLNLTALFSGLPKYNSLAGGGIGSAIPYLGEILQKTIAGF